MSNFSQNAAAPDLVASDMFDYDDAIEHTLTPIWREAQCGLEWARLRWSPTYYGVGVPHGSGQPVLLIPGFMSSDLLMLEMHRWLKRIGYRSSLSRIPWNNDCPNRTAGKLMHRVRMLADKTGHKVALVGHSLGGMLARSVAQDTPEYVDRVITLGSPFRSLVKAHPAVVGIWDELKIAQSGLIGRNLLPSCGTGHCTCDFVRNMSVPKAIDVAQFAVYSKNDGVADWSSCMEDDVEANNEVVSTHIGMVFSVPVYRAVADRLAQELKSDT